jgi:peroxiredoxin
VPNVLLQSFDGRSHQIADLSFSWVVYYFYSGIDAAHPEGRVDGAQDAALHRAYSNEKEAFSLLGVRVIGISSQSETEQLQTITDYRIVHRMLIDPACQCARLLNLPVFEVAGRTYYQRLALLTCDRRVAHAFYPVEAASRNPSQVLTWMRVHGAGPSA